VTGDTVERRSVACPVAKVAKDFSVFSLQRPRVPRFLADRRGGPQRQESSARGYGMTDGTRAREDLSCLVDMAIVMTPEASGPVTVAYIVGIGCPANLHGWEDISVINSNDGAEGLVDKGLLILENVGIVFGIVRFDNLPHCFFYVLLIVVVFY
jgi:hypothetical protein